MNKCTDTFDKVKLEFSKKQKAIKLSGCIW